MPVGKVAGDDDAHVLPAHLKLVVPQHVQGSLAGGGGGGGETIKSMLYPSISRSAWQGVRGRWGAQKY